MTTTVPSEPDVLRAAADRFRRAARLHEPFLEDPDSKRWHDAYTEAADCLETWALNGGVPPLGKRAEAASAPATRELAGPQEPSTSTTSTEEAR